MVRLLIEAGQGHVRSSVHVPLASPDGTVGVLGGLEAMRALKHSGLRPRRSIELIMFTSEEPTRFGIGCLGSRLLSGTLDPDRADALQDKDDSFRVTDRKQSPSLARSGRGV